MDPILKLACWFAVLLVSSIAITLAPAYIKRRMRIRGFRAWAKANPGEARTMHPDEWEQELTQ